MDEKAAGRLEQSVTRAVALLGTPLTSGSGASAPKNGQEGSSGESHGPDAEDARLIAARISRHSTVATDKATTIANDIVDRAAKALGKLAQGGRSADVNEEDALALESVMQVRGRPAVRVLANHLEPLRHHPGSEFWQEYIAMYEERIVAAAGATGAVVVSSFASGNPPWVQGSAWLIAPDCVVTNRHVLLPDDDQAEGLVEESADRSKMQLRGDYSITIEFGADDRTPSRKVPRRVTEILYVANVHDPVDIALLTIEPYVQTPLELAPATDAAPDNLFVVGHPALMAKIPEAVQAVFGNLDGHKRISFGKRLRDAVIDGTIAYDASTVGGFSGAPVLGISGGSVAGLHYYGNPLAGNLAIPSTKIRAHVAYQRVAERVP
jgi:hypothetical protein